YLVVVPLCLAWEGDQIEQSSLMSPETGLSLCRQTAGCGFVLTDGFRCSAYFLPLDYFNQFTRVRV